MFILFLDKTYFVVKKLAVFGSGGGGNAENIYNYFFHSKSVKIVCFCTNNKNAFIVTRGEKLGVPVVFITKDDLSCFSNLKRILENYSIDYIILAGFLLKIPKKMILLYPKRIINIHPSLLPKYGGKGMYGKKIHLSVLKNQETESGITIHFVNEEYDEGEIILQKKITLGLDEGVVGLQEKIRALEFKFFPKTIENIVLQKCL